MARINPKLVNKSNQSFIYNILVCNQRYFCLIENNFYHQTIFLGNLYASTLRKIGLHRKSSSRCDTFSLIYFM